MREKVIFYDVETFPNDFCLCVKYGLNTRIKFEACEYDEFNKLSSDEDLWWVGYNNYNYDNLIIKFWLDVAHDDYKLIYILNQHLFNNDLSSFEEDKVAIVLEWANKNISMWFDNSKQSMRFGPKWNFKHPFKNNIDLFQLNETTGSLKNAGIILNYKSIMETPIPFGTVLSEANKKLVAKYCFSDVDLTELVYLSMEDKLKVRDTFYKLGLENAHYIPSAQIAENYICYKEAERLGLDLNTWSYRYVTKDIKNKSTPNMNVSDLMLYKELKFNDESFNNLYQILNGCTFSEKSYDKNLTVTQNSNLTHLVDKSAVRLTSGDLKITDIRGNSYQIGVGGMHSHDIKGVWRSNETHCIINFDVKSYYPALIVVNSINPTHIPSMSTTIADVKAKRFEVKNKLKTEGLTKDEIAELKTEDAALKLIMNSGYGKLTALGSKTRDPRCGYEITMTGQIMLLKLIDMVHNQIPDCQLINANTDGICYYINRDSLVVLNDILRSWELITGVELDVEDYNVWAQSGVNSYVSQDGNGKIKSKGFFKLKPESFKETLKPVCVKDAVHKYFIEDKAIDQTIRNNKDYTQFFIGGSVDKEKFITTDGEILKENKIRFIYSKNGIPLKKLKANGTVAKFEGDKKLTLLLDCDASTFPWDDVDYDAYIEKAEDLVTTVYPKIKVKKARSLSSIKFPYYSGVITETAPLGIISLNKFIKDTASPTKTSLKIFEQIAEASKNGDNALKGELKKKLKSFTPGVIVEEFRKYDNIKEFTGLAVLDFDKLESEKALDLKQLLFDKYQSIICCYLSPSIKGVKAIIAIPIVNSVSEFKDYFRAIEKEFGQYEGFDSTSKNPVLPLFTSYDKDILYRTDYILWEEKEEEEIKEKIAPIQDLIVSNEDREFVYNIIKKNIRAIDERQKDGHLGVRATAYTLGGYVGGGYLTEQEAIDLISDLIQQSDYLAHRGSGTIGGYIKTAKEMIENGIKAPLYLAQKQEIKFNEIIEEAGYMPCSQDKPFPLYCLPTVVKDYIELLTEKDHIIADIAACGFLWAASTLIGNSCKLFLNATKTENASLWFALVQPSGTNKTNSLAATTDVISSINQKRIRNYYAAKNGAIDENDEFEEPLLEVADGTIEGILYTHSRYENRNGLGLLSEEIEGWLKRSSPVNPKDKSDRDIWLKMWNNKNASVRLKSRGQSVNLKYPFISVIGSIQPSVISKDQSESNLNSGFLDRIIMCHPRPKERQHRSKTRSRIEDKIPYETAMHKLGEVIKSTMVLEDFEVIPKIYQYSVEGDLEQERVYNMLIDRSNSPDITESLVGLFMKEGQMIDRVALILQVFEDATTSNWSNKEISKENICKATVIMEHLTNQAIELRELTVKIKNINTIINNTKQINRKAICFEILSSGAELENKSMLAHQLNCSRTTLYKWIEEYEKKHNKKILFTNEINNEIKIK